jgi:hypothetical protein
LSLPFRPRRQRDTERGRRAAEAIRRAGGSAAVAANADILVRFDPAYCGPNELKLRVEQVLADGVAHPRTRHRYGRRAEALRRARAWHIDAAIARVTAWHHEDLRVRTLCLAGGRRGQRLSSMVLAEMQLILRWLRRTQAADIGEILEALTPSDIESSAAWAERHDYPAEAAE